VYGNYACSPSKKCLYFYFTMAQGGRPWPFRNDRAMNTTWWHDQGTKFRNVKTKSRWSIFYDAKRVANNEVRW